ncbi:MAG: PP2C family protein-serine/threonine phosphatase [Candidatus Eiseniibacteriota bacterium]
MAFEVVAATAYLTCGALMLFLGFVVLRENPRQRVNRATAGMLVFGGLGPMLGAYSTLTGRIPGGPRLFQDVFAQFAFLWEFWFPSVLLFALVFPTLQPLLRRRPWISTALFVPHVFHVLLVLLLSEYTGLLDRLLPTDVFGGRGTVFGQAAGVLHVGLELAFKAHVRFFSFVNLAMAATSWFLLMGSSRRTTNPKLRSQVRTIRLGLGLSLALYSGGELVPNVFGLSLPRSLSLPLVTVSLLVGAASILVAIVRVGFLDVRFIVRRGLVYGLAAGVVVALYLFVGKQIDTLSAQLVGARIPVFETTFLVLSLFLLQPVLSGIERAVDRGYSRDRADVRNAFTRLAEDVSQELDSRRVCEMVAGTIRHEMVLRSVAMVNVDPRTGAHRLTVARDTVETVESWKPGAALFRALAGRTDPVPVQELVERPAGAEERDVLAAGLGWIGVESVLPLYVASRDRGAKQIVGALALGEKVTETRMTFEETSLVSLLAHQVGISLQNGALHEERLMSRLLEEEVSTARKIQEMLLPSAPPELPGWELSASNKPSRHVGGDYHDFLPMPAGETGIAIGDVSGKGVPAALLMSNLQATLRVRSMGGKPSHEVVEEVNRQMCRSTGPETFISFFLGDLRPECGTFGFTNAGHNAPLLVRRDGRVETLDAGGLLLGVFPEATYERGVVGLEPGDALALYTDGVTEAADPDGEFFSEERLVEALVRHRHASAAEIHDHVLDEVRRFQRGRDPDDDLTLILLKRSVEPAGAVG